MGDRMARLRVAGDFREVLADQVEFRETSRLRRSTQAPSDPRYLLRRLTAHLARCGRPGPHARGGAAGAPVTEIVVYKSPELRMLQQVGRLSAEAGITRSRRHDVDAVSKVKNSAYLDAWHRVTRRWWSGYVIEGHVPARRHRAPAEGAPEGRRTRRSGHGHRVRREWRAARPSTTTCSRSTPAETTVFAKY